MSCAQNRLRLRSALLGDRKSDLSDIDSPHAAPSRAGQGPLRHARARPACLLRQWWRVKRLHGGLFPAHQPGQAVTARWFNRVMPRPRRLTATSASRCTRSTTPRPEIAIERDSCIGFARLLRKPGLNVEKPAEPLCMRRARDYGSDFGRRRLIQPYAVSRSSGRPHLVGQIASHRKLKGSSLSAQR